MDTWKYYAITHRDHAILNPISSPRLDEIIDLVALPDGARVLDIACGKGELLVRLAGRARIAGVGVDISPFFLRDARENARSRAPAGDLRFLEMDAGRFRAEPGSFDLACCLGASWIFGGHPGTLRALSGWTRPGGLVVAAEPFWLREPDPAYLEAVGFAGGDYGTHEGNVRAGLEAGLVPLHAMASSRDEWDRYEGLQWRAAECWALANPGDGDVPELLAKVRKWRDTYLRWGRDTIGQGIYLFRRE